VLGDERGEEVDGARRGLDAAPVALALGDDGLDLPERGGRLAVPAVSALVEERGDAARVERRARRGEALDLVRLLAVVTLVVFV